MSSFSGRCDLYDHISGMGGWYDKKGNQLKFGEGHGPCYSDEYRDFLAFKKATGGVLHQHRKFLVTPWNHEEAERLCSNLKIVEHKKTVSDKRVKTGEREEIYYTYTYWGKEYTLKELNKKGIYIDIEIRFDTLLDLIPYYPYIVCVSAWNDGKEVVYISDKSYVDEQLENYLSRGFYSDFWQNYKKELQDHYIKIILKYFNREGREHIEEVEFNEDRVGKVSKPIDENFKPEWREQSDTVKCHWTSPKVINAEDGLIQISKEDYEHYIGKKALIYYVEAKEHKLNLD